MTLRSGEIAAQDRKRFAVSAVLTLLLYGLSFGAAWMTGLLEPKDISLSNQPVIVNLIGRETARPGLGAIAPVTDAPDTPLTQPPAPVAAPVPAPKPASPPKATPAPKPATPKPPVPTPRPPAPEPVAPKPVPVPDPLPPQTAAAEPVSEPVEPWVPGERPAGSRVLADIAGTTTIRKSEKGNSIEMTLGGAQGTVGQNVWVPIYTYMPLPRELPADFMARIPAQMIPPHTVVFSSEARQKAFRMYYELAGGVWKLKSPVALDEREPLWGILEDAGYDASRADYKAGRSLAPVVIGFTFTRDRKLKDVVLVQTSGDPVVDESVLYGFRQGTYSLWNKTGDTVNGTFTMRF